MGTDLRCGFNLKPCLSEAWWSLNRKCLEQEGPAFRKGRTHLLVGSLFINGSEEGTGKMVYQVKVLVLKPTLMS